MCPSKKGEERLMFAGVRSAFDFIDKDGDGKIQASDLESFFANAGAEMTDEDIADMIRFADKDKNGCVDLYEFERAVLNNDKSSSSSAKTKKSYEMRDAWKEAFNVMDRDGDGLVGVQDLCDLFGANGVSYFTESDISAMIETASSSKGKGVRFEDFVRFMTMTIDASS